MKYKKFESLPFYENTYLTLIWQLVRKKEIKRRKLRKEGIKELNKLSMKVLENNASLNKNMGLKLEY